MRSDAGDLYAFVRLAEGLKVFSLHQNSELSCAKMPREFADSDFLLEHPEQERSSVVAFASAAEAQQAPLRHPGFWETWKEIPLREQLRACRRALSEAGCATPSRLSAPWSAPSERQRRPRPASPTFSAPGLPRKRPAETPPAGIRLPHLQHARVLCHLSLPPLAPPPHSVHRQERAHGFRK